MATNPASLRVPALRRFATAITILNVAGHLLLGFEQSWSQPFVALAAAYGLELLLEALMAWSKSMRPRFLGGPVCFIDFLLPAHITGLAVNMLLYANSRYMPIIFAVAVAIGSKYIFRIADGRREQHFFNPSNFGIAVTLILFPKVGIAPPYQFTENLYAIGDWVFPALIILSGSFLNTKFTKKIPLILAWVGGFAIQAIVRAFIFDLPIASTLLPMTGVAFLLFTFYMISDPGTTPREPKRQIVFGLSVAGIYSLLMASHVVFGLFFALGLVCAVRGIGIYLRAMEGLRVRKIQPAYR